MDLDKNKLTYDIELESIYLVGDFGAMADGPYTKIEHDAMFTDGTFTVVNQPERSTSHNFTKEGLLFFAADLKVSQTMNIEVKAGENEIMLHLYASNRNLFGPHHHINGECYNVELDSFIGKWSCAERL